MNDDESLAVRFDANRPHLRAVAFQMLGSATEADDAVQECWFRLTRSDPADIENLGGWLTTVVARICLDQLRARRSRREEPLGDVGVGTIPSTDARIDPEDQALLADSVGPALLVVLEMLTPAERIAFVLHDTFAVPFDEIAPIVGRSPAATRQLASRARRRVQGVSTVPSGDRSRQRQIVDAFLAAARDGDFDALLAVLDPDVVFRHDPTAVPEGAPREVHGAAAVAEQFSGRARVTHPALIDGTVGIAVGPRAKPMMVLGLTFTDGKIAEIEVVADAVRLGQLDVHVLDA